MNDSIVSGADVFSCADFGEMWYMIRSDLTLDSRLLVKEAQYVEPETSWQDTKSDGSKCLDLELAEAQIFHDLV